MGCRDFGPTETLGHAALRGVFSGVGFDEGNAARATHTSNYM